jgi:hypothetical protein
MYDISEICAYTSTSSTTNVKKKKIKDRASAKNGVEVKHPIFKEMENFVTEDYWKSILASASMGKFHQGVQYNNGIITFKNKVNKGEKEELDLNNPERATQQFLEFMNDKVNVLSPLDRAKRDEEIRLRMNSLSKKEITTWSQVRKEVTRTYLIDKYIKKYSEEKEGEKLTPDQEKDLEFIIRLGILTEYLNNNSIIIKDGKIDTIIGLILREDGLFDIELDKIKVINKKSCGKKYTMHEDMTVTTAIRDISTLCTQSVYSYFLIRSKENNLYKKWLKFLNYREKKISRYVKKNSQLDIEVNE